MEKYCKNCGAALDENTQICPDCGREVENSRPPAQNYCHNCGFKIDYDENFCRNCGVQIKSSKAVKESILKRYENPIIIGVTFIIISLFILVAFISLNPIGGQVVEVDAIIFEIPEEFVPDSDLQTDENRYGIHTSSKTWNASEDYIQIDVIYSTEYDIDQIEVLKELDGEDVNLMGHDGKYAEERNFYRFSFVEDNKLCTVHTNNPKLFEEITVI